MVRSGERAGSTLIEAEIALLILAVGLLTTIPFAVRSLGQVREAARLEHSVSTAAAILDSLVQLGHPAAGTLTRDGVVLDWSPMPVASVMRIVVHATWVDGRRSRADSLIAFSTVLPPRLHGVP